MEGWRGAVKGGGFGVTRRCCFFPDCHPERSEGSVQLAGSQVAEVLRFAQDDKVFIVAEQSMRETGPLPVHPNIILLGMASATKGIDKKLESLRDDIRHHEYQYYVLDNPQISD